MKMFAAGGEGTGGESAQRTRRVAVFSLLRSFLAGDAQPPSVPPSCVVARYYRIILGYFTRGASDFVVDQRFYLKEDDDSFPRTVPNQPFVFARG